MGKIKITLKKSPIHKPMRQKKNLEALGLSKLHHSVVHENTPQIKGMVNKVSHMVETEDVK